MPDAARPQRTFHVTRGTRVRDAISKLFAWAGIGPACLLSTRGAKTGRQRTTPVIPVERDGKRWLVAPYGAVAWVHNARAGGQVTIHRGRDTREYAVREVRPDEAAPILKSYIAIARATQPYFDARTDSPVEDFLAEADRHPVFELSRLGTE